MGLKAMLSELFTSHDSKIESASRVAETPSLSKHNFSVKKSMAQELQDIGFSKAAIGRVLHISMKDVETMLDNNEILEK